MAKIRLNTVIVDLTNENKHIDDEEERLLIQRIQNIVLKQNGAFSALRITLDSSIIPSSPSSQPSLTPMIFEREEETAKMLSESILRFIQSRDKITQLTSNLLKSWLYYHYYHRYYYYKKSQHKNVAGGTNSTSGSSANSHSLPIAVLQRTKYRRPYIHLEVSGEEVENGINDESYQKSNVNSLNDDYDYAQGDKKVNTNQKHNTNNNNHVHQSSESVDDTIIENNRYCCCKSRKNDKKINDSTKKRRSKYDKMSPYSNTNDENSKREIVSLPFSVSHQYPITALSFISIDPQRLSSHFGQRQKKNESQQIYGECVLPLIGLDVVIFNPTKQFTVNKYLSMYETNFTNWEWRQISVGRNGESYDANIRGYNDGETGSRQDNNDPKRLIEFYLRWSMKEAYSKALGLGLGLPFQSFESHLIDFDNPHEEKQEQVDESEQKDIENGLRLWDHILSRSKKNHKEMAFFPSHTYQIENGQRKEKDDSWYFIFIPHVKNGNDDRQHNLDQFTHGFIGCSCICVQYKNEGNIMNDIMNDGSEGNHGLPIVMEDIATKSFMSMQDLCDFHSANTVV